jgi:hypothetical protein
VLKRQCVAFTADEYEQCKHGCVCFERVEQ